MGVERIEGRAGTLRRTTVSSPIGPLVLVADGGALIRILFANQELGQVGLTPAEVPEDPHHPVLAAAAAQLGEYFAGARTGFDLPLRLSGTEFQRRAWLALADIAYGSTVSYAQQAAAIGKPGAFRAVGSANGSNPLPIVLPCHRVVGADGSLTGFGGGIEVKRQLLELEQGIGRLPL